MGRISPQISDRLIEVLNAKRQELIDSYMREYTPPTHINVHDEASLKADRAEQALYIQRQAHNIMYYAWHGKNVDEKMAAEARVFVEHGKGGFITAVKETLSGNGLTEQEKSAEALRLAISFFMQWQNKTMADRSAGTGVFADYAQEAKRSEKLWADAMEQPCACELAKA